MSLYLAVFDGELEIAGYAMGHYSDYDYFIETIGAKCGAEKYPTLLEHSDCDGEWSTDRISQLQSEIAAIRECLKAEAPIAPHDVFEHTTGYRVGARSLYDCFHTVDGTNMLEALQALTETALRIRQPILFQ